MANFSTPSHHLAPSQLPDPNDTTDYGPDFDDEDLEELNREVERIYANQAATAVEDNPITNDVEYIPEDESATQVLARVPHSSQQRLLQRRSEGVHIAFEHDKPQTGYGSQVKHPDLSSALSPTEPSQIEAEGPEPPETEVDPDAIEGKDSSSDTRPPIQRYRAPPRRALSVTDLVSPAWCELQYSFDLQRHGRKRATPAMKAGTVVHERLEKEVYTTVPIQTTTREEKWGLKIWNLVSGLGILAETGMTRELEVWGTVDGELVGGVIDEVGLRCPNPALEEQMRRNDEAAAAKHGKGGKKSKPLEPGQSTLSEFMLTHSSTTISSALQHTSISPSQATPPSTQSTTPLLYITDVKTRRARSIPNDISARPTKYQLMLYHRFLSSMIHGHFSIATIAQHYNLDLYAPFGDAFIAQVAALDADLDMLLANNSLAGLWSLIPGAFTQVAHANAGYDGGGELRISPILTAEYRDSNTGEVRGSKTFLYDERELDAYLENGMQWWHGEREARGVEVEEAFKCQICAFAPECGWRIRKVEEARRGNRDRRGMGGKTVSARGFAPVEVVERMERP